ncbi:MAG: sigma-54-dependent Fis family transcriptional regulator, partial [Spirochaetes bacterium]|nr:sigma-54-dependent Fis family transcriptional regulator [Spirochaetota bacterium]
MSRILIIDDEKNIIRTLETFLKIKGHDVRTAGSFEKGYMNFRKEKPEIVILDVFLKGRNGIELLSLIHREKSYVPVIMISGHADIATAVESIKRGAWDFIEKPIDTEKLEILLGNAARQYNLASQADVLKNRWEKDNFFIGSSPKMSEAVHLAEKAAPTDLNVLIYGKNGTGKELLSYYIYLCSSRVSYPFITINCAAIPDELFESELFGYKKGAFTGADTDKPGYFL